MKICPMCGSDILAADTGSKCSSCGANLEVQPGAPDGGATEGNMSPAAGAAPRELDDSAPIIHTDLDVVQSGHAFWAETPPRNPDEDTDPDGVSVAETQPKTSATSDECEPEPKRVSIFEASPSNADAPSLAELARRRKEQIIQGGFTDPGEIRLDHVTQAPAVNEPDQASAPSEQTKYEANDQTLAGDQTVRTPQVIDLDDTQPAGVRAQSTDLASVSVPGVVSVTKSPDIAYIDDNKLVVPGAKWSSGDKVVVSGRTYELRRKIAKYPVSPREMLIGTGAFLGGLIMALMISVGTGDPKSAVFGVVREGNDGKLLAGVTIALEETNQTVQSDPAGMFYVAGLAGGIYTLVATDPIYGSTRQAVTVGGDATSILMELERPELAVAKPAPPPAARTAHPAATSESNRESASSTKRTSQLAFEAPVSNARIFLDGKLLGVGNSLYSDIAPGKHQVEVKHDGFELWRRTLTFAAGETMRLQPDLAPIREAEPVRLSAEEYAVQGKKAIEARNYKLALENFDAAIKIERRPQFLAWRAEAFVGMKDLHHAEADFLQSIYLFRQSGQDSRLEGLVERSVLVVPASAALWLARGEYMYTQRKLRDAEKSYRRALELGASPVEAHTGIGLAQYAGGTFQGAFDSWMLADQASGETDPLLAGYIALASARLQYRASCRDAVRRLVSHEDVLTRFRAHPDWDKVQRLTGQG